MSFSSEVKEELKSKIDNARHCQIAQLAAILAFSGEIFDICGNYQINVTTENPYVTEVYMMLLEKVLGMSREDMFRVSEGKNHHIIIDNQEMIETLLMTVKWKKIGEGEISRIFVDPMITQKECCKRAFIRGAFLAAGSISDPLKFYHYEIVCNSEEDAERLCEMFTFFNLDAKITGRKKNFIVYIKEGSHITDCLNLMGAVVSQMNLYNVMILKGMRNDVNRKVNCETANLNKTIAAAVKQVKDIEYISNTVGLGYLKENLYEVAVLRLENQDMNLSDLGKLLNPPVSKSGVNHRLKKISEIAETIRAKGSFERRGK